MEQLVERLRRAYPALIFVPGNDFRWDPAKSEVRFDASSSSKIGRWSLLHELAHALLEHSSFTSDFSLLKQEVEAWTAAGNLAPNYHLAIPSDYVEDCLDSYRDWLYARSTCPNCTSASLQADDSLEYLCFNCSTSWKVSRERFCRPYRRTEENKQILT